MRHRRVTEGRHFAGRQPTGPELLAEIRRVLRELAGDEGDLVVALREWWLRVMR